MNRYLMPGSVMLNDHKIQKRTGARGEPVLEKTIAGGQGFSASFI
jgi:hypothetical protein